jgi:uncharacterized protein YfiM (DUF2279 family)
MQRFLLIRWFVLSFCLGYMTLFGQDTLVRPKETGGEVDRKRLTFVLAAQGTLYVASFTGLYFAWYSQNPQSSFHFFNDNGEWMQMDKAGHFVTANYISRLGYHTYRWSGLDEKRSAWFGAGLSFAYLLNIEILDAFSSGWGFSPGDLTANTLGISTFLAQQLVWGEQRFYFKYSFHRSSYPPFRPEVLGKNLIQEMVKDYNGQSYWISANISSFLPESSKFPAWLNIAAGYGAEGMVGAYTSGASPDQPPPGIRPCRQFYLSLDVDLTRIPTNKSWLKTLFTVFSFIKIPAPAIEFNTLGEVRFHPVYY